MDLFSLGFLLLILVASGGIAFVADGLGKKIGKKRLSLCGLRPKHVAQIGTVGMGVVVSFLTISLIAVFSRDARQWLKKGTGLISENRELDEKNRRAKEENDSLSKKGKRLQNLNADLGGKNHVLQAAIGRLQNSLRSEEAALGTERASLQAIKVERGKLVVERDRLTSQSASLKEQVAVSRRQYETTNGRLALAQSRLALAERNLTIVTASLTTAKQSITALNKNSKGIAQKSQETYQKNLALEAEVRDREIAVEALKKEQADLIAQRDAAEKLVAEAQKRYDDLLNQLGDAGNRLAEMQDQFLGQKDFFVKTTRSSRTESMTYRKGEELARVVVPGGSDPAAAELAVTRLLRSARQEAATRGAKPLHENGQNYEAADIIDRKDPKTGLITDSEALRRALVAAVADKPGDQVVVASSSLNAFAGEPVSLDLAVMPNPLVYRRNETVAETQIDGAQAEDRILAQLSDFVAGRVRDRAMRDKMIPRLGTAAPFGEVPTSEVLSLVRDVKQRGRSVRVQAVTNRDVHAADPLRLEFRVR